MLLFSRQGFSGLGGTLGVSMPGWDLWTRFPLHLGQHLGVFCSNTLMAFPIFWAGLEEGQGGH
jgi:hypothetical protein